MLQPKLFTTLQEGYSPKQFFSDVLAGVIVGIIALPLAIAFGIASGVSPEKGLITAVVAGFIISALGGSRVQIGGPTGAFVVIVYGIVQKYGFDGLVLATMMAGVLLIIMGFARMGSVIKFIPHPVIVGFTSGIAVIIFSSQVKDFLGLSIGSRMPAEFLSKWQLIFQNIHSSNFYSLAVALGTIVIISLWPKTLHKLPGSLAAILLFSVVVHIFHWPAETIGDRFGDLPRTLPMPKFPTIHFSTICSLIQPAFTIALLGGIESLLSAVVADGMIGGKHRSNMELVAQGIANIGSALFGGIPATGAIARTATNVKNGGRTPVAGIIHALTLFLILLFAGQWAKLIPMACLAGVLVVVAYHMSEWRSFLSVLRSPRGDIAVLLLTFGLTVLVDLTVAIEVGMVLSAFLFMRKMALVSNVGMITKEMSDESEANDPNAISKREVPEGVEIFEVNGPLFFGAAYEFMEAMKIVSKRPKVRIIRMRNVPVIDASGIRVLKQQCDNCRKYGIGFIISDLHAQPLFAVDQAGLLEKIGKENIFGNIDDALNRTREILSLPKVERKTPFIPTVKREMN